MDGDRRVEELRREERAIRAYIRDLTADKQARLRQIRAELRGIEGAQAVGGRGGGNAGKG